MKNKQNSISKAMFSTFLGTMIGRITGFIRDIIFSFIWGTSGLFSSFLVAFTIPNLFRKIFGEGALSSAFLPTFTEKFHKNKLNSAQFAGNILGNAAAIMSLIIFCGISFCLFVNYSKPEQSYLFIFIAIMLPYMLLICLSSLFSGILNVYGKFLLPSFLSSIMNIILIIVALISISIYSSMSSQLIILSIGVLVAGVAQFSFMYFALKRTGFKIKPTINFATAGMNTIMTLFIPAVLGASITQINVLLDRLIATFIGDYAVSSLYFSERLTYLPVGLFGVALGVACMPIMSKAASKNNNFELSQSLSYALRHVILLTLPCCVFLFLYKTYIVEIVFMRGEFDLQSLNYTVHALSFYIPGIPAFSALKVILPVYFSRKDTKTPVRIGIICLFFNLILGLAFIPVLQHGSLALATTCSAYLNIYLLIKFLKLKPFHAQYKKIFFTFIKVFIFSLISFVPIFSIFKNNVVNYHSFPYLLSALIFGSILSVFILYIILKLTQSIELKELHDSFIKRKKS